MSPTGMVSNHSAAQPRARHPSTSISARRQGSEAGRVNPGEREASRPRRAAPLSLRPLSLCLDNKGSIRSEIRGGCRVVAGVEQGRRAFLGVSRTERAQLPIACPTYTHYPVPDPATKAFMLLINDLKRHAT